MDDTKPSAEATVLQSENERLRKEVETLGARVAELDRVARAAQRAEAKKLFLEVAADNGAAMELYRRAGFLGTGLRRGYYERPGSPAVDAVTLALKL